METIHWEVTVSSPPETARHCKKCGAKTQHVSSGLFRVNANARRLDIWLVYRCVHCKTTWKLPLYARTDPKSLPPGLLERFLANDEALARQYAMDADLLRQNGAEAGVPGYAITGPGADADRDVRVEITCQSPCKMRVAAILREKLGLSRKALEQRVAQGAILLEGGDNVLRQKLNSGAVVVLRRQADAQPQAENA